MKKRILALALAGTTAFSVFGAAMSANAIDWNSVNWDWVFENSSHIGANDGAEYKSYDAAGDLRWGVSTTGTNYVGIGGGFLYAASDRTFENLDTVDGKKVLNANLVFTVPWNDEGGKYADTSGYGEAADYIHHYDDTVSGFKYYDSYADFANAAGCNEYVVGTFNEMDGGQVDTNNDGTPDYIIAEKDNKFYIFPKTYWDTNIGYNESHSFYNCNANVNAGERFYLVKGTTIQNGGTQLLTLSELKTRYNTNVGGWYAIETVDDADSMDELDTNMQTVGSGDVKDYTVYTGEADKNTKTSLVEADGTPVQYLVSGLDDIEEVMAYEVEPDDYVYAYDYELPLEEDDFADAWENGTLVSILSRMNNGASGGYIYPETGTYNVSDIREEVIYAWEDFLDEIGVSDLTDTGLTRWARATLQNYAYTYTDDFTISFGTTANGKYDIYVTTTDDVDLYNFEGLIADIMYRAPSARAKDAQTSELVYLMQQYYKYTEGGYVDVKPVETDNWGDLLVALAQAPTEDEFSTSVAYRRYTNKVEDLVEQYEEAETAAAVSMAEADLYDFVTDYNSSYRYSTKADTTVLATAIDNTFFNYNWKKNYTDDDTNKTIYPAEVYAGAVESDGDLNGVNPVDTLDYNVTTWALYPKADYSGSTSGSYPGVDKEISNVNDSYFWFYNVYDLAYNVYSESKYQSVIDLMAETLNEAVANLTPTASANARSSDILGAEEANDPLSTKVETDYNEATWSDLSKINTYITERVSNDEIGRQATNNAEKIADLVNAATGRQRNQTVVTRTDINNVSSALSNAQSALTALRNDQDNYNAAQANALEAAIEDCEYIIDLYNGDYSKSKTAQSVNDAYDGKVGDKDQILKSMVDDAVQSVEDAINFKNVIMGWTETDDGWMYGVEDTFENPTSDWGVDPLSGPHYLNFGWAKIGNTWFYFDENGIAKQSDWMQVGNDWYYFNSNCGASIGWAKVDGKWYYFNGGCRMMTGWVKVDGNYYYLNTSGAMVTGWCQVGGKWYYLSQESNSLGQMLYSTTTPDGYQVGADGALVE